MLGELTDRSNQGRAFAGLTVAYRVGQIIGLPIGGYLAHPEINFPRVFGEEGIIGFGGFWKRWPYVLPCVVGGTGTIAIVIVGYFVLEEV